MLVRDIMRSPAVTVSADTTLENAYRTMREKAIRHLPVVEEGRLVGVITDRDLRLATSALSPTPFSPGSRVSGVMCPHPLTADPSDPLEDPKSIRRPNAERHGRLTQTPKEMPGQNKSQSGIVPGQYYPPGPNLNLPFRHSCA